MITKTKWVSRVCLTLGLAALAASPLAAQNIAQEEDGGSYGYLRVVEGSATLIQAGEKDGSPADVNQPVLAGDRIWVEKGSKVEIVLADRNIVRLDGGSELLLEHLAESPDAGDPTTVLRLLEGNMQVVVTDDSLGDELPRVETPNATVLPQDFGVYRIATAEESWSEVTVRRGQAEVRGGGERETVNADESAVIQGNDQDDREAAIEIDDAPGIDGLERWAQRLDQDSQQADVRYVDDDLRYSASSLGRNGSWVTVENERYWRPQVAADWRPYSHGRWAYTPSGMTWVSYEPWGWVPYHYGSWDYVSSYGWLWRPGRVYSPAWVYWYWGSDYTGWCPIGYYTHYYSARFGNSGFRSGVYGWAGGDWGLFSRWSFVSTGYFRGYSRSHRNGDWDGRRGGNWRDQRDVRRFAVPNDQRRGGRSLGRGIITTDTRPLTPDTLRDPRQAVQVLASQPRGGRRRGGDTPLTDVTPFIARRPDLPTTVTQVLRSNGDNRIDGTPLRPATLGRGDRGDRGPRGARNVPDGREPGVTVPGGDRTPRVGRPIPGSSGSQGSQGGVLRPDRPDRSGREPGAAVPDTDRTPRVGRSIPSNPGSHGDQGGGAPRPDRTERPRNERPRDDSPATSNDGSNGGGGRTPRTGRSIPSNQGGGAPRPDRTERPRNERPRDESPATSDDGGRTPRLGRSIPSNQGDQDETQRRPVVRPIPERREAPQRREAPERPSADRGSAQRERDPQASERPAPAPRVEPRPTPERTPERTARPKERPPEHKDSGRENGRRNRRQGDDKPADDGHDDGGGR
jgi:hypothetical protein